MTDDMTPGAATTGTEEPAEDSKLQADARAAAASSKDRPVGFWEKLSTGTGAFNILGPRRIYYIVSGALVVASILLIVFRGFQFGIDFAGGTSLEFQPVAGQELSTSDVAAVVTTATGVEPDAVQTVGSRIQISSAALSVEQVTAARDALVQEYDPPGGVSDSAVSETWGGEISQRALLAVIVFLIAVAIFLWIRYEIRVALGAVVSTLHDLVVTAGIYSLVGFEVTPATVIGLLTILGFSLYDTVVVYDKVQENTKGLTSLTRRTYTEAANLAINQTLMRSINTSLIALLPVAGLLVAGVAILGSGTLKDLALVMLIGMLVGAYSSVFIAVPLAVDLKIREPEIRAHTNRVRARRKAEGLLVDPDGDAIGWVPGAEGLRRAEAAAQARSAAAARQSAIAAGTATLAPGAAPRPGARPVRPSGKAGSSGSSGSSGKTPRPAGKGQRPPGKRGR